jgi:hypothetical protein
VTLSRELTILGRRACQVCSILALGRPILAGLPLEEGIPAPAPQLIPEFVGPPETSDNGSGHNPFFPFSRQQRKWGPMAGALPRNLYLGLAEVRLARQYGTLNTVFQVRNGLVSFSPVGGQAATVAAGSSPPAFNFLTFLVS